MARRKRKATPPVEEPQVAVMVGTMEPVDELPAETPETEGDAPAVTGSAIAPEQAGSPISTPTPSSASGDATGGWLNPGELPYEYRHPACGGVSFLLMRMPARGQRADACGPHTLDGRPIAPNEEIGCEHCGMLFSRNNLQLRHVHERVNRA